ncbi:MAG: hypothetical protein ACI8X3_002437, partial [Saprospiraceae bacterium]
FTHPSDQTTFASVGDQEVFRERGNNRLETNIRSTTFRTGCSYGDCMKGVGVLAYADGSKYEGNFSNGKLTGYGTWYFANGEKYIGMFHQNYCHGRGIHYKNDGSKLIGNWEHGTYVGELLDQNGAEGCILGDCDNGFGTYIFKNGKAKYEGSFLKSKPQGQGICHYSDGNWYEGDWKNGSFEGVGEMYMLDGSIVSGIWKEGAYQGNDYNESMIQNVTENFIMEDTEDYELAEAAKEVKVWAVVVGVASYKHMPSLQYTDDDAYRMYAFLKSPEGGALKDEQIKILVDDAATKDNILFAMDEIFRNAGPNDLVMMYYSGHGLKGSFLPIDFDGTNNKLLHTEISGILNRSKAKYKLFIADACHSGSMFSEKGAIDNVLRSYYTSLAKAAPGTALILSSKSGETSLESSGLRQGVFSHFLLRGLKGEADTDYNNIVNVKELYEYISKNVKVYTAQQQSPVIEGDYDSNMTVSVLR